MSGERLTKRVDIQYISTFQINRLKQNPGYKSFYRIEMFYMSGPIYRPADIIGRYWPIVDISVSVNISPDIKYKNDAITLFVQQLFVLKPAVSLTVNGKQI